MVIERQYVTPKEAARVLGYNVETVLRWLRTGRMVGTRYGRTWRISVRVVGDRKTALQNATEHDSTLHAS